MTAGRVTAGMTLRHRGARSAAVCADGAQEARISKIRAAAHIEIPQVKPGRTDAFACGATCSQSLDHHTCQ